MGKILFVDDDELVMQVYLSNADARGVDAVGAFDGLEALAVLEKEAISVVVSDVNMQNMNGLELLENIKRKYPGMPVIMASAVNSATVKSKTKALGANDYFVKPFDLGKLFNRINELYNGY